MIVLRNLLRNKARSIITLSGIAVGIATYGATAAVTDSLYRLADHVTRSFASDVIVQSRGAANPVASRIAGHELVAITTQYGDRATPIIFGTLRETWNAYAPVLGLPEEMLLRFGLHRGRAFRQGGQEAVVGAALAQRQGFDLGSVISLGGKSWTVVGIYSIGHHAMDSAVAISFTEAQTLLHHDESASFVILQSGHRAASLTAVTGKRAPDAQTIADQINARFETLQAAPIDVFMRGLRLFRTVDTFVRAVGLIAFWACVLFVTNTLVHALSERMREIGILMAMGWRRCRILWVLLSEGALLSLCGALLGNGLGVVFLRILGDNARLGFGWLPATIPLTHVAVSIGLALAVAVVSSLWPAFVLLRFSPAEALRYE